MEDLRVRHMTNIGFAFLTCRLHIMSQQPGPHGSEEKETSGTEDDNYYYYFDRTSLKRLTNTHTHTRAMKRMKMTLNSRRVFIEFVRDVSAASHIICSINFTILKKLVRVDLRTPADYRLLTAGAA